MTQWSERGVRPTEPGRYDVECDGGCRVTFDFKGGDELPGETWDGARFYRIPDPPVEIKIPDGKWFRCKHRGRDATGLAGVGYVHLLFKSETVDCVPFDQLTDIRILPEEFQ